MTLRLKCCLSSCRMFEGVYIHPLFTMHDWWSCLSLRVFKKNTFYTVHWMWWPNLSIVCSSPTKISFIKIHTVGTNDSVSIWGTGCETEATLLLRGNLVHRIDDNLKNKTVSYWIFLCLQTIELQYFLFFGNLTFSNCWCGFKMAPTWYILYEKGNVKPGLRIESDGCCADCKAPWDKHEFGMYK